MLEFDDIYVELSSSIAAVVVVWIIRKMGRSFIRKHAVKYELEDAQRVYANKFLNFILGILLFIVMGGIWNFSVEGLSMYFASIFTVVGVALFASWSILSNITASLILFFNSPFKIGSTIKIMDKDDSVEGIVRDISFFTIQIERADGTIVLYPNNLALQKAIILKKIE